MCGVCLFGVELQEKKKYLCAVWGSIQIAILSFDEHNRNSSHYSSVARVRGCVFSFTVHVPPPGNCKFPAQFSVNSGRARRRSTFVFPGEPVERCLSCVSVQGFHANERSLTILEGREKSFSEIHSAKGKRNSRARTMLIQ